MSVFIQLLLFFLLLGEGFLARLLYSFVLALQRRFHTKPFIIVTDLLTVVIAAGIFLLTCLLLADTVRVFYAVFFLSGLLLSHFLIY